MGGSDLYRLTRVRVGGTPRPWVGGCLPDAPPPAGGGVLTRGLVLTQLLRRRLPVRPLLRCADGWLGGFNTSVFDCCKSVVCFCC